MVKGIIERVNEPVEWINEIILIEKPNKSFRVCLNPKNLNQSLITEKFPIPTLNELGPGLRGKKHFSLLDIKDAFYHIKFGEESSKLCSFITPIGTMCFKRMPFGIKVAPEAFQKLMTKYFGDLQGGTIYFDDMLIAADSKIDMDLILAKVFERAKKYNIKFNPEKFEYNKNTVKIPWAHI